MEMDPAIIIVLAVLHMTLQTLQFTRRYSTV